MHDTLSITKKVRGCRMKLNAPAASTWVNIRACNQYTQTATMAFWKQFLPKGEWKAKTRAVRLIVRLYGGSVEKRELEVYSMLQ